MKYCRSSHQAQEFDMSQRLAFCVYSGNGLSKLRTYLTELFNTITKYMDEDYDETEYDDDFSEGFNEVPQEVEMELGNERDIDVDEDLMHDGPVRYRNMDDPHHPSNPTNY